MQDTVETITMQVHKSDPTINGRYLVYCAEWGDILVPRILTYANGEWLYRGSGEYYRGEISYAIGPIPI